MTKTIATYVGSSLLVLVLVFAAETAMAQDGPEEAPPEASEAEATTYDFDDDLVTGDLVRPDGEMLNARRRGTRSSLIRIREHFIPEMLKSVENL